MFKPEKFDVKMIEPSSITDYRACVCDDVETQLHLSFHCGVHSWPSARAALFKCS